MPEDSLDFSRMRVMGWYGEHGFWIDPTQVTFVECEICNSREEED